MEQLQKLCSSSRIYDISDLDRQRKLSLNGVKGNRTPRPLPDIYGFTGPDLDMTETVKRWHCWRHGEYRTMEHWFMFALIKKYLLK